MRFSLYSPFIVIPSTVLRGMVKVDLDTVLNESGPAAGQKVSCCR